MDEMEVLEIIREAAWMMLATSAPLLIIAMVVGLVVALLQALTSVQEMTLAFVPKLAAMLLALVVLLPFMMSNLIAFTQQIFARIAAGG
jgi:flagellar biosynthesis protein FliQ